MDGRDESAGGEVREEGQAYVAADAQEFLEHVPELTDALTRGCDSFPCVALAFFYARGAFNADERERQICRDYFPELLKNFEKEHGKVRMSYFGQEAFAAAVLTENDEIGLLYGPKELRATEAVDLLFQCESLSYASYYRLDDGDRRLCQTMIFAVIREILRRLDAPTEQVEGAQVERLELLRSVPAETERPASSSEVRQDASSSPFVFLRGELERAEAFFRRSARHRAQMIYLRSMLYGGLLLGLALVVLAVAFTWLFDVPGSILRALTLSLAAGGLGAVVSVLSRTTFGELQLNLPTIEAGVSNLRLLGALRPVVGAIFGVALFVLIASTLLPVEPPSGSDVTYVYVAVAFLAGFSERLAQDMFVRTGRAVSDGAPDGRPDTPLESGSY